MGLGRFISRSDLVQQRGRTLEAVLRDRVSGLRVYQVNGKSIAGSARGVASTASLSPVRGANADRCYVQVIIDNFVRYQTGGISPLRDLRSLGAFMIAGIEFYTVASTPLAFNLGGNAGCGTLIIWLQH